MTLKTAAVIVNYNSGSHLKRCLTSLAAHAPGVPQVVVDNASTDGSDLAAETFQPNHLIRNALNKGFGAAVNQGVAAAPDAAFVLLLNPDCVLSAGAVETLRDELVAHPECAIAAPRILDEDGSVQGSVRGDPTMMTGLFGRTTILSRWFPNTPLARRNVQAGAITESESRTADWVSGACMLVRLNAFEAVGGFDERYFLYWEDADLCRRLRARHRTIRYVPRATIVHVGGGSSRTARELSIRAFHRSAFLYYRTHVARGPLSRWIARGMLVARCQWKLAAFRVGRG